MPPLSLFLTALITVLAITNILFKNISTLERISIASAPMQGHENYKKPSIHLIYLHCYSSLQSYCNMLEAEIYSINERHDPQSTMLSIAFVILPRLTA